MDKKPILSRFYLYKGVVSVWMSYFSREGLFLYYTQNDTGSRLSLLSPKLCTFSFSKTRMRVMLSEIYVLSLNYSQYFPKIHYYVCNSFMYIIKSKYLFKRNILYNLYPKIMHSGKFNFIVYLRVIHQHLLHIFVQTAGK